MDNENQPTCLNNQPSDCKIIRTEGLPLPEIAPQQSWCCENGCGECTPVQTDFEYSKTTDSAGNVLESKIEKIWVSHCCKAELMLWDESKQYFVEWQPASVPVEETT